MEEFIDALIGSIMSTSNPTDLSLSNGSNGGGRRRAQVSSSLSTKGNDRACDATTAKAQLPPEVGRRRAATYLSRESNSETVGELRAIVGAEVYHRVGDA
jgi:hypothetical protein